MSFASHTARSDLPPISVPLFKLELLVLRASPFLYQRNSKLKSILIYQTTPDKVKSSGAWRDLLKASEEVSNLWSGYSALEEIQAQREK
jgi:hypothetical protein